MKMVAISHQRKFTIDDFVSLEAYANVKHEYLAGQIWAMAGGTPEHGTWAANVIGTLAAHLRGKPYRVQTSDVRIRVQATGLDTYPDVSVVCGPALRDDGDRNAIVNPALLFEVTSPGTEDYDRGDKLEHYKAIPSLKEVVLVAHDARRIDVVSRDDGGAWIMRSATAGETLRLASIDCDLAVDDVYLDQTQQIPVQPYMPLPST